MNMNVTEGYLAKTCKEKGLMFPMKYEGLLRKYLFHCFVRIHTRIFISSDSPADPRKGSFSFHDCQRPGVVGGPGHGQAHIQTHRKGEICCHSCYHNQRNGLNQTQE